MASSWCLFYDRPLRLNSEKVAQNGAVVRLPITFASKLRSQISPLQPGCYAVQVQGILNGLT